MLTSVKNLVSKIANDRRGVTAMEYGMIAAATIVAIATFMTTIKTNLSNIFSSVASNM